MSNESENERIDLSNLENQYKEAIEHNSFHAPDADKDDDLFVISDLIAKLKRCYDREDKANEAMLSASELLMYHYDIFVQFTHTTDLQDEEILDTVKALRKASE